MKCEQSEQSEIYHVQPDRVREDVNTLYATSSGKAEDAEKDRWKGQGVRKAGACRRNSGL